MWDGQARLPTANALGVPALRKREVPGYLIT